MGECLPGACPARYLCIKRKRCMQCRYSPKYPDPPMSSPPPCPSPPPRGGNRHYLVPKKTCCCHISQDCATVTPGCLRLCPPPSFCPIAPLRPLKMFPQGTVVRYVRSTGEPVLAAVQGPSPHGEQYRTITDEDRELDSDSEVVWAKSARGTWGLGHTFGDKLYFTRNIPEGKWIPKNLEAPTVAKPALKPVAKRGKQAAAKPAAASASIPVADGQHVQLFKTMWDRKRKFYTVPVQNKGHAQK